MRKFLAVILASILVPIGVYALPVSWDGDFNNQILQPLRTFWGSEIRGNNFTATSTTAINNFAGDFIVGGNATTTGQHYIGGTLNTHIIPGGTGTLALTSQLHDAVTLAGTPDYITLSGQQITRNTIDISSHTNLTANNGVQLVGDNLSLNPADTVNWTGGWTFADGVTVLGTLNVVDATSTNMLTEGNSTTTGYLSTLPLLQSAPSWYSYVSGNANIYNNLLLGGFIELSEITAPAQPASDRGRIFAQFDETLGDAGSSAPYWRADDGNIYALIGGDGGGGGASNLNALSDVTLTSPANRNALMFDSGDSLWKNRALVEADISDLAHPTPGGSNTQLQFNNGGAFGGARIGYTVSGDHSTLAHSGSGSLTIVDSGYLNSLALGDGVVLGAIVDSILLRGNNLWTADGGSGLYRFRKAFGNSLVGILDFSGVATSNKTFTFPNQTGNIALSENTVNLTGNQTVAGVKTIEEFITKTGSLTPTDNAHLTTKSYVDALAAGFRYREPARAATTEALPANTSSGEGMILTGNANGALAAQDGVTLIVNNRLLVKNESTTANNGMYIVTQVGDGSNPYILERATDFDEASEMIAGATFLTLEGTVNSGRAYALLEEVTTVGTDPVTFIQVAEPVTYTAGDGLSLVGTEFSTNLVSNDGLVIKTGQLGVDYDNETLGIVTNKLAVLTGGITNTQIANSTIDLTAKVTGDLPFANLAQGSALSVLGVTGNATADVASIAAGTDHQVLRRSGTSLAFGAINLASSAAVTGELANANLATISTAGKVSGAALTSLSSIPSGAGVVPPANLGTGTSITTKFLRGDGTWQTVEGGSGGGAGGNMSSVIGGAYTSSANTSGQQYLAFFTDATVNSTYAQRSQTAPFPFTIKNLYAEKVTGTNTATLTLYKNGVATDLTVALVGAGSSAADTTNEVTFVAGDTFAMGAIRSSGTGSWGNIQFTVEVFIAGHDAVTLAGQNYLTLTGQEITAAQINLASHVTGDLPFANLTQGSALSVLGVTGNSTADVASIAAGSDHQVLRRSGTSVAFGAVNLAQSAAVTGLLPYANFENGSALSVTGRSANSTGVQASIAAGTDHQVLRRSGTTLGFGAIALNQSAAVTGTLLVGNGGTGVNTFTAANNIPFAQSATGGLTTYENFTFDSGTQTFNVPGRTNTTNAYVGERAYIGQGTTAIDDTDWLSTKTNGTGDPFVAYRSNNAVAFRVLHTGSLSAPSLTDSEGSGALSFVCWAAGGVISKRATSCDTAEASPFLISTDGTTIAEVLANQWKVEANSVNRIFNYTADQLANWALASYKKDEIDHIDSIVLNLRCTNENQETRVVRNYELLHAGVIDTDIDLTKALKTRDGVYGTTYEGQELFLSFDQPNESHIPKDCAEHFFTFDAYGYYEWDKLEFNEEGQERFWNDYGHYRESLLENLKKLIGKLFAARGYERN